MRVGNQNIWGRAGLVATRNILRYPRIWLLAVFLLSIAVPATVWANTPISRGYTTDKKLSVGSLVSLHEKSSEQVVAATSKNVDNLLGVVINDDNSLLAVKTNKENQVQVVTSGIAQILVSDINGAVARGDHITASPINGVGMKATGNVRIVGVAQDDLTGGSQQTYKDSSGEHTVNIGQVSVLVNVAYYFKEPEKTIIPTAIQNIANALAGKTVDTLPILISAGIFLVMLIVVVSIIYSMIRSSIISVGRNPMSQKAVYRDLIQLSTLVLVILGVGFSSIYMVLTRV